MQKEVSTRVDDGSGNPMFIPSGFFITVSEEFFSLVYDEDVGINRN